MSLDWHSGSEYDVESSSVVSDSINAVTEQFNYYLFISKEKFVYTLCLAVKYNRWKFEDDCE